MLNGYVHSTLTGDLDCITCLTLYRKRDAVEECFMAMKVFWGALPLNVHNDETIIGFLFTVFIGMIIRTKLHIMMK